MLWHGNVACALHTSQLVCLYMKSVILSTTRDSIVLKVLYDLMILIDKENKISHEHPHPPWNLQSIIIIVAIYMHHLIKY
jgi:hypothetical protein